MLRSTFTFKIRSSVGLTMAIIFGLSLSLAPYGIPQPSASPEAGPQTFATPDFAGRALWVAAAADDRNAILAIFGPAAADLISSGDPAQEEEALQNFANAYQAMNRWRKQTDGSEVLFVGADNNPFPIPLKRNSAGQWYFDTAAGKEEILSRRIGADELAAIDVMSALVDAQTQYFSQRHGGTTQYALKFVSDDGTQDGLYWKSPQGQPKSPLGPLAAYASTDPDNPQPFHGYFYRMLTRQGAAAEGGAEDYVVDGKMTGGFAFVAYPAHYGGTGIMTFIVNQSGIVYQKDLGKNTTEKATAMTEFNSDNTWSQVSE
jgi:hypothetical protein